MNGRPSIFTSQVRLDPELCHAPLTQLLTSTGASSTDSWLQDYISGSWHFLQDSPSSLGFYIGHPSPRGTHSAIPRVFPVSCFLFPVSSFFQEKMY